MCGTTDFSSLFSLFSLFFFLFWNEWRVCFFFSIYTFCNFYQETSYLLDNGYMYIAPRIIPRYISRALDRIFISIYPSPMLPPCYYLLVTSFSSSSSSSSSSTTYHFHLANNKHLVSCSCLGKRTKEMTGWIEVRVVV